MQIFPMLLAALIVLLAASAGMAALARRPALGSGLIQVLLAALGMTALAGLAIQTSGLLAGPSTWLALAQPVGGHAEAIALGIRADQLGLAMTAFIAGIGLVVFRYARRYLLGDPRQAGFLAALSGVVAAAMVQALSPGLVQFALGWIAASLGLHRLLGHERHRAAAQRAAAAKFITSRLGDVGMAVAVAALLLGPGTTDFAALAAAPASGLGLLAAGAIVWAIWCKTALFPLQPWLIGTVEAPTPLSALMHAGVVNMGGFLVLRHSPLLAGAPATLDMLLAIGLLSALVGPLVMWAQTDLKRSLAWSTVGQMGFMAVQCGLGAYGAALLHLIGHGCYKADAFLRSGTLARAVEARPAPGSPGAALLRWLAGLVVALAVLAGTYLLFSVDPRTMPGGLALLALQAVAMAQLLATPTAHGPGGFQRLLILLPVSALYAALTTAVEHILAGSLVAAPVLAERSHVGLGLALLAPLALAALGAFWVALPALAGHPVVVAWRIHAGNGFYLPHLAERLLRAVRPQPPPTLPLEPSS